MKQEAGSKKQEVEKQRKVSVFLPFCFLFLYLSTSLLLWSCASAPKRFVYNEDKEYVALRQVKTGDESRQYQHPYKMTPEELEGILRRVYYRHQMFISFAWSKPARVFSGRQESLLAYNLSKALSQAAPDEQIDFSVTQSDHKHRRTTGVVFIDDYGFNIVLSSLQQPDFVAGSDQYNKNETKWKLWPLGSDQSYVYKKAGKKDKQKNWLVIKLQKGGDEGEKGSEEPILEE